MTTGKDIKQHLGRAKVAVRAGDLPKALADLVKVMDLYRRTRLIGQEKYEVEGVLNEVLHAFGTLPAVSRLFPRGLLFKADEAEKLHQTLQRLEANVRAALEKAEYDKILALKQDIDRQIAAARKMLADNQPLEARKALRTLVQKHPEEPGLPLFIGNLLFQSNQLAESIEYYKQAMELDPKSPAPLAQLVTVYETLGKLMEAEEAVLAVMRRFGASDAEYLRLAKILLRMDRNAEAREAASNALNKNPGNAKARELLDKIGPLPSPGQ